jgi:exonuclease SbcD
MKILHTSDWHVGKVLKGRDRHDEHVSVLGSLVGIAKDEDVDLVLIAGDLFETAAPTARSQGLVMRTLLALREDQRQVVVIAGNHDNQGLIEAVYRPVLGEIGLHVLGMPRRPEAGGTSICARGRHARASCRASVPVAPLRGPRGRVMFHEFAEHALDYSSRVAEIVTLLTADFTPTP